VDLDYRRYPIVVVDDEPDILRSFQINYGDEFTIVTAESGSRGLELLGMHDPAVIVGDQRMPRMDGSEFFERSRKVRPDAIRVMLTGFADLDALVRAINAGQIYRYVSKPWDDEELRILLRQAFDVFHLTRENKRLMERLADENVYLKKAASPPPAIIGDGPRIREVVAQIATVAPTPATVLIEGETGTGKELVARGIHEQSPRAHRLFVAFNCAELTDTLAESELFGHKRGAFTGALADRKGLFEYADGGTIFLDEVSSMSLALQGKLLRVLQEREVRPLGDNKPRPIDVRVIAATNQCLEDEITAKRFRDDLYFRLKVFLIRVPPLRDRREDIPLLARHLITRISARLKKRVGEPSPETLAVLSRYSYRGNVRELENVLEQAVILAEPDAAITEDLLPDEILDAVVPPEPATTLRGIRDAFERRQIEEAVAGAHGVLSRAAESLGITYRGLAKKMDRLGIPRRREGAPPVRDVPDTSSL
jgi:DNA-binding NtrC family response regulator